MNKVQEAQIRKIVQMDKQVKSVHDQVQVDFAVHDFLENLDPSDPLYSELSMVLRQERIEGLIEYLYNMVSWS